MSDKILQAMKLLVEQPDLTVADVVEKCGYADDRFTFDMCFKLAAGMTPSKYRKAKGVDSVSRAKRLLVEKPDLPATEIARQCGYAEKSVLCICFKRATGMTLSKYRQAQGADSVSRAKRLLVEQPELSIAKIATQCGYSCNSTLLYSFKKQTGMTPSKYRRKALILAIGEGVIQSKQAEENNAEMATSPQTEI